MKQLQDDPTGTLQALALEMGPTISLGTACGFASGFALKKAGKVAIVVRASRAPRSASVPFAAGALTRAALAAAQLVGGVFMGLQGLASVGVIQINWAKLSEHFGALGDVNGDGTVDAADAEAAIEQLQKRLTANMGPAAGGFGGGLLLGLRYG